MRIASLTAYIVRLPLKREIKHASATRHESDNLLICCKLADGTLGWGEGVPRSYVTGETVESAFHQLSATALVEQLDMDCGSWHEVIEMCQRLSLAPQRDDPRGCHGNALRCAVELSVLDAYGRLFGEPVSAVTQLFEPARCVQSSSRKVRYSTAITAEGARSERISALKMRLYGFRQCKIKVGVQGEDDAERLQRIRRWIGRQVDLRVDANEAWHDNEAVERINALSCYHISCVEQPVAHEEVEGLAEVRRNVRIPIMLDESLTSMLDAKSAIRNGTCDLFNIRLSKCGGFLNSLLLAKTATEAGLGYQLGCHPGESGILSAAGRHWAATVGGIRYLEGSYDRHLLSELLTNEDITFGYGGWAPALAGPGLGVTVSPSVLDRVSTRQEDFPLHGD